MDQTIKASQLVFSFLGLLIIIITSWVNINTRISVLENQQTDNIEFKKEIRNNFQNLNSGQNEILIKLENKKNRDK